MTERMTIKESVRSSFRGGEARRALFATAAGVALGFVAALFARREKRERRSDGA